MVEALFLATWLPQTGEQMDRMHTNDEVHEQSCKIVGIRRASVCEPDPVAKDRAQFRLDRIECRPLKERTTLLVARQFRSDQAHEIEQIGRASCRESECQYVSIHVVAVSLKKKKKTTI